MDTRNPQHCPLNTSVFNQKAPRRLVWFSIIFHILKLTALLYGRTHHMQRTVIRYSSILRKFGNSMANIKPNFSHDGDPPHICTRVKGILRKHFTGGRFIGQHCLVSWLFPSRGISDFGIISETRFLVTILRFFYSWQIPSADIFVTFRLIHFTQL